LRCPACKGLQVGRVGSDHFYCWNCYIEFAVRKDRVSMYEVAEDGTLVSIEDSHDIMN
jgi:ribosomal protein L37AE/L43A